MENAEDAPSPVMPHFEQASWMVQNERFRQERKWVGRTCATLENLELSMVVLGEEYGELCQAILKDTNVLEEAIHTAAVATAIVEYLISRARQN